MKNLEKFNARELTSKHACLMEDVEQLPPGTEISPEKKRNITALEKELRKRLYNLLNSDVLPVIATNAKIIKDKALIAFNFDVISELNTLIDRFKVEAKTKDEAWKIAKKRAKKYPSNVNLKIS